MEGPKQVLSIKVSPSLYQRLKKEIGTGKVSRFIEKTVSEKLDEQAGKATQEQKEFERKLITDYQREWNQAPDKEDEMWEEAGVEDLTNE